MRRFGLPVIVHEVVENLASLAEQKAMTVSVDVPADLPDLVADDQRVGQVLVNLLSNAIKFTHEAGHITIRAWVEGESLRCEVEDSGIGIAPEDLPKLFTRFSQVDSSNTRAIGVESELGTGSTFWFTLPLHVAAGQEGREAPR